MDHGIIFSAPMIQALCSGWKTQTRRLATSPLRRVVAGDTLWVRETVRAVELRCGTDVIQYPACGEFMNIPNTPEGAEAWGVLHYYRHRVNKKTGQLVPAIHMPRWVCRMHLHVLEVRIERLQDLGEDDALAEGARLVTVPGTIGHPLVATSDPNMHAAPITWYRRLWDSLHTAEGERWEDDPEILVLRFEVERLSVIGTGL